MKYEELANQIIDGIGGKENVISVFHCVTRLRFKLKDESKAKTDYLKNLDGIVTIMQSGGQYQVVIGNHVTDVFDAVVKIGGFETESMDISDAEIPQGNLFDRFVDLISGIFAPTLGVLAASGMIKGLVAMLTAFTSMSQIVNGVETNGTLLILNATGDALFYAMPVFLGYTAAKKFRSNTFIAMAIGMALIYPSITALSPMAVNTEIFPPLSTLFSGSLIESPVYIKFLGIPVIMMSYASSVIPIILSIYVAAKVEKYLSKIIPSVVKTFLLPFFTLLIMVPLTFLVIGPVATWAGDLLGAITSGLYNFSPILTGIFIGLFWQVFVMFGLHWGLIPVMFNNIATLGYDPIVALSFACSFAQIGAVAAVYFKTKNKKVKSLSIPAFISGIFGVTEPAIYGVTLPLKKPFYASCVAGAVGGGILGLFNSFYYTNGGMGIFAYPNFIDPSGSNSGSLTGGFIASAVAFVLGLVFTYMIGFKDDTVDTAETVSSNSSVGSAEPILESINNGSTTSTAVQEIIPMTAQEKSAITEVSITSPLAGKTIDLNQVKDDVFASGAMGKGIAIMPTKGHLKAPISGTVTMIFPTGHAIGITSDEGVELLIHLGMNTVELKGKGFTILVEQGQHITQGMPLIDFDIDLISEAGYTLETPIIITNSNEFSNLYLDVSTNTDINFGDALFTVKR